MKFIIDNIWLLVLALLSGGALLWPVLQTRGAKASPLRATQLINQGKTTILDVRDAAQFAKGHLRDAKNIALSELSKRIGELDKVKTKPVIVVCQSGDLSSRATQQLQNAGFAEVFSLEGGLTAWQALGLPISK